VPTFYDFIVFLMVKPLSFYAYYGRSGKVNLKKTASNFFFKVFQKYKLSYVVAFEDDISFEDVILERK